MACPSEAELLAFQLGELPEAQILSVGEHLAACTRCEERTQSLDGSSDTILSVLRERVALGFGPSLLLTNPAPEPAGYEMLGLVGRGGMGLVYKARHRRLDRLVALKFLHAQGAAELARFEAEARAVARLQHPHIVQIFEVGQWQGQLYLALEFLGGGSLADLLTGKPQDPRASAALVETLARAVHYAHMQKIVHRDLKPANILVVGGAWSGVNGAEAPLTTPPLTSHQVKITDFGIAKHLQTSGQTRDGDIVGTASYMAPEQAAGRSADIGPASDIYSLGVILYELLTGRVPLQGSSDLETVLLLQKEEPVSPRRLQPGVPRDLETICLKCLQKEPRQRYASADALADDLGRMLAGEPIRARPTPLWERAWKWARRRPAAAALILLAALIVGVGFPGVTALWMRAEQAAADEKQAKKTAQLSDAETQVVMKFLEEKILYAANPTWNGGLGEKATLREALDAALPSLETRFADQPLIEARLRRTFGIMFSSIPESQKAAEQFARARELYAAHKGPADRDTLSASINLARSLFHVGQRAEAEKLAKETLAIERANSAPDPRILTMSIGVLAEICFADEGRRGEGTKLLEDVVALRAAAFGVDNVESLATMDDLAKSYSALGRHADAVKVYEKILALRRAKDGQEHPETVRSTNALGTAYLTAGRGDDAIALRQDEFAYYKSKYGKYHADTIARARGLAFTYNSLGRKAEAHKLFEDAHKLYEEQFSQRKAKNGPDHEATLVSMNLLADSYANLGRKDEAFKLREERLALLRAKLGPNHADTQTSMDALADQYTSARRHPEAVKLLEELTAQRTAKSGLYSSATLLTMARLADSYFKAGRRGESLKLRQDLLAFNKDKSGPEHIDTQKSMDALANCYAMLRRHDEALKLYQELYELRKTLYGPGHDTTLATAIVLASQCKSAGQNDEALRLREEVFMQRKARYGPDHEATLSSMNLLAESYANFGRHNDAARLREELYALRKAKLGPDSSVTLFTMGRLAASYFTTGRRNEAIKLYEESLALQKAKLGPDHVETLRTKHDLATCYSAAGRYADALKLHEETLATQRMLLGANDADTLRSMWGVAFDLVKLDRGAEAVPILDDCINRSAGSQVDREMAPRLMALRQQHFQRIQDAAGCRETAQMWEQLNRTDASSLYTAAKMRAVTAAILCATDQSAAAQAEADVEADRAMAWLQQAVAAGFKTAALVKREKELDTLRDSEDFQKLMDELEEANDVD